MADNNNKMSREEAGRKGGEATAENHDKDFYQDIGHKGGDATAENHDKEFYQEIGPRDRTKRWRSSRQPTRWWQLR
ncbi:protein GsiB [Jeotgalibacillus soli]|uniref:Protein GsiB n=1 Tax=Jeotgalibacillus soli TaxID=889306 RepID=A0A0C2VN98_9BACL|nr:protein GsiB [Jeotgalibacillus soli]